MLTSLLTGLGVAALLWVLYRGVKNNPGAFSKGNLSESAKTLGVLGLILIGVVGIAVFLLKR